MRPLDKLFVSLLFDWRYLFRCFIFGISVWFIKILIIQFVLLIPHGLDDFALNDLNGQLIQIILRTKLNRQPQRIIKRPNLQHPIIILTQLNLQLRHILRLSKILLYSLNDKKHTELTEFRLANLLPDWYLLGDLFGELLFDEFMANPIWVKTSLGFNILLLIW